MYRTITAWLSGGRLSCNQCQCIVRILATLNSCKYYRSEYLRFHRLIDGLCRDRTSWQRSNWIGDSLLEPGWLGNRASLLKTEEQFLNISTFLLWSRNYGQQKTYQSTCFVFIRNFIAPIVNNWATAFKLYQNPPIFGFWKNCRNIIFTIYHGC